MEYMIRDDVHGFRKYISEHPDAVVDRDDFTDPWIDVFVAASSYDFIKAALECGFSVNCLRMPERGHALSVAILKERIDYVQLMCDFGADCNLGRTILTAISFRVDQEFGIQVLNLML
jgi:hypothetical protein